MHKKLLILILLIALVVIGGMYLFYQTYFSPTDRTRKVFAFLRNPESQKDFVIPARSRCGDAPFIMPTTGVVGFIWHDSFHPGHQHQGIDIFSGKDVGETPVFAAYEGYLTRLPEWKSTVIIRIPSDPLQPDRQIWAYYTHMADSSGNSLIVDDFPPGTTDMFISEGALLGYQGNYSGSLDKPTGIHLHFSIVRDDGEGMFMNELEIRNTLDPSPYFGLAMNARDNKDEFPICDLK